MEPGGGSGGGGGRLPFPGLTGGLRLDDLADAEPDADPTPAVVHFRSTMASMGYAVTLRLDSATSPTSPDDDGRQLFSPLVTPTPQTAALRRAPFGPAAGPRAPLGGRGRGRCRVADSGGVGAAGDSDTAALSSPVSASTPGGFHGGVPPLPCKSIFFPPSSPPSAVVSRSFAAAPTPRAAASASAAATAASAQMPSDGTSHWGGALRGCPAQPAGALSPLPLLPPLQVGVADALPSRAVPEALPPPSSLPLPRAFPRHPLLDAPATALRSGSTAASKRPFTALLREGEDATGGWWLAPPPAARRPVRDASVVLAPLRPTAGGGPRPGGDSVASVAAAAPLPPPPLPPPSGPPRSFWQTVIAPPLTAVSAPPPAGSQGVPPPLSPPRPTSVPPLDSSHLLLRVRRSPLRLPLDVPAAAAAAASMTDDEGALAGSADTDVAAGDGAVGGGDEPAGAAIPPRPYTCDECGSSHSRSGNLAKHVRLVHGRRRPHACPECGARFGQRSNLSAHARAVHRRLRPHACAECAAAFAQKSALVAHVSAVHRRLRPYACAECGYVLAALWHARGGGGEEKIMGSVSDRRCLVVKLPALDWRVVPCEAWGLGRWRRCCLALSSLLLLTVWTGGCCALLCSACARGARALAAVPLGIAAIAGCHLARPATGTGTCAYV